MNRNTNPSNIPGAIGRIGPAMAGLTFGLLALHIQVCAQTIDPYYSSYNIRALGEVPGLPYRYGGLTFKAGDPNTLLIGGNANSDSAQIFQVAVVRGPSGHLTGFSGSATYFAMRRDCLKAVAALTGG